MRQVVIFIASSLDGFIARRNGDVDWLFTDEDYGYTEFYESIDTVLMGRKTYDKIAEFDQYPYLAKKSYVFSKSFNPNKYDSVTFVSENLVKFTQQLRLSEGKDIWLVGGSEIIKLFVKSKMIDEIIVSIHPLILGDGIPLFLNNDEQINLKLKNCINFSTGLVQLHYEIL